MGCCISTKSSSPIPKSPPISREQNKSSLPEEETVKEVLSETPAIPKHTETAFLFTRTADEKKHHQNGAAFGNGELCDVKSEIRSSRGERASVSTALTETRENNAEFHETWWWSSATLNNRSAGRSSGRRSEPSNKPGRRMDSGEGSGRRSKSPVIRTGSGSSKTGLGDSKSGREPDKSPGGLGGVGYGSGERTRKMEEEEKESRENMRPPTSNELLENPPVSLECFIFL